MSMYFRHLQVKTSNGGKINRLGCWFIFFLWFIFMVYLNKMENLSLLNENLKEGNDFSFPFTPYDIQLQFMQNLYAALENKQLGIFESPTGTGKSLSILCGAVKWLKDHQEYEKVSLHEKIEALADKKKALSSDDTNWFETQSQEIEITRKLHELKIEQNTLIDYEKKIEKFKKGNLKSVRVNSKKSNTKNKEPPTANEDVKELSKDIEDEDIILEENNQDILSEEESDEDDITTYHPTQVIIASRTHSQLTQFIGEIKKTSFSKNLRVISLGSRQNYCINSTVRRLNNMTLINEKCLDMQKKKSARVMASEDGKPVKRQKTENCQCPFYKQTGIEELRDFALNEIHDIEDLVHVGKELSACPYYASRKAAEDAELILVPYNTLLHKSTREANGISLKNNVVIIDEAHNLLEALAQMYGSEVNYPQLYYALHQVKCYKERYNVMFSANTLRHVNQLIFVINKLLLALDKDVKEDVVEISTLESFVVTAGIEQYNFFNLVKFCKNSKITQKIRSYSLKYSIENEMTKKKIVKKGVKDFLNSISSKGVPEENKDEKATFPMPNNPLLPVVSFLDTLNYSHTDGRILVSKTADKQSSKLQFLLLNPSSNFTDIVSEARSVIVAGGTMKPYTEFRDRLFINSGASSDRIIQYSCDHIIPAENILPIAVTKGPKNKNLLFNFSNRLLMGESLKTILIETCGHVKGGIVVFFPSYNYENWVYEQVKSINFGRPLFREPQHSGLVDEVLQKYSSTIEKSSNALLFSVVGGKLSEGLNFSDDLGRCVIVVGLPYPNVNAPDLKEKMSYLDKTEGSGAGQKFYENLCMKAVNQCIGRSVRHKNDYATVLLLDQRFARANIQKALPDWIQRSFKICDYSETFTHIKKERRKNTP
ncbi:putative ATP-dependent DNA helicase DDX11-like protein 8 isoform X1 [Rhynchophorus ferrugineus]|uniref:putative ATP-dependent DNA helicase DDX11-like protein 8 isoform X1 n=1 Tax=Rhynchophorus ferrugineus TaxID=354439 RepID=UPI003FCE745C